MSDDNNDRYVTCVHHEQNKPDVVEAKRPLASTQTKPEQVKNDNSSNATIGLKLDTSAEEKAAREKATAEAKAKLDKEYESQLAAALAATKAKEAENAAAEAARVEKMHQWCMADPSRLTNCSCSKWSKKGPACGV